jgi:hypothetical protein
MLSASLVSRWRAPRVKGLRAALVLAKAARFAVLAERLRRPLTPRPTGVKTSQLRKHVVFVAILALLFERVRPEKHTPEEKA